MRKIVHLVLLFVVIICLVAACSEDVPRLTTQQLSDNELIDLGYYAYVLPEDTKTRLDWRPSIYIDGLNSHCGKGISAPFYPVRIAYFDTHDQLQLSIYITPRDHTLTYFTTDGSTIEIHSSWIPDHKGSYYLFDAGGATLKFKDLLGMEVIVTSKSGIKELVKFILQLEYVGEDITTIGNPWVNSCQ